MQLSQYLSADPHLDGFILHALKISPSNISLMRALSQEGLSENEKLARAEFISSEIGADIFELSTCNRVLICGFNADSGKLLSAWFEANSINYDSQVNTLIGVHAWEYLVEICSGLDSLVIGELQIFGQFRKSIQWHKDHDFIGPDSEELLQQIIWASKKMRNKLGFNHTTESMLNLGTDAIEECIANESHQGSVVLGCGDMGVKAVETLIDLGETDIIVANRSPQNAIQRLGPLADKVRLMTIQEWRDSDLDAGLLISTIRASEPLEDESYLMNDSENAVVFDFAWPPSISRKCTGKRTLRDMEYWVLKAQHLAREVGLKELQSQGQEYLLDLSQRASESRERKGEAEFRKLTHKELARLASTWIEVAQEKEIPQVQAFSKEIANKITDRHGFITIEEFVQWVLSTPRALEEDLVVRIADDVEELVMDLHEHLPPSEVRA